MTEIQSSDLPLTVNNWTLKSADLPDSVTLPVDPHDIPWTESMPTETEVADATLKTLDTATEADKDNWLSDAVQGALRQHEPPSGEKAYAQMEAYLRDKYTLNEWANMMDANPILIELIKNEEYQNAVERADYLANDDNSLVDSEDADKLREVTNV